MANGVSSRDFGVGSEWQMTKEVTLFSVVGSHRSKNVTDWLCFGYGDDSLKGKRLVRLAVIDLRSGVVIAAGWRPSGGLGLEWRWSTGGPNPRSGLMVVI